MPKINPLYLLPPVVFLMLFAVMYLGLSRENPNELPSQMIGRSAPTLTATPIEGFDPFTSTDLEASHIKIVNFWASWCAPCRVEHPSIQALADLGIPVYGVNYKDKSAQAKRFLSELGNPYEKIIADEGRTGLDWGLYGVPETFVIDAKGKVVLRHAGPVTQRVMSEKIFPLLAKK